MAKGKAKPRVRGVHPVVSALLADVAGVLGPDAIQGTQNQHYKIVVPGKGVVFVAASPSDWRAARNARSRLRQLGVKV